MRRAVLAVLMLAMVLVAGCVQPPLQEVAQTSKEIKLVTNPKGLESATLAGGCFWCMEAVFQRLEGVVEVTSGFSGGTVPDPSYEQVCTGSTGHAESIHVLFDPKKISYRDILEVFFQVHDPTTLDRQGADVGTQYRSAIFYENDNQHTVALDVMKSAQGLYKDPIVTQIVPFQSFFPADAYHKDYYNTHTSAGYCRMVIEPKLEKFRKAFHDRLKATAAARR